MSNGEEILNGVPQVTVLGLVFFSIFTNDLENGIECILSKFANDTNLNGVADVVEGRIRIDNDLYKLENWSNISQLKFNKAKPCTDRR